jgi:hypothetical protein
VGRQTLDHGVFAILTQKTKRKLDAHFHAARKEIPTVALEQEQILADAIKLRVWIGTLYDYGKFFTRPSVYLMGGTLALFRINLFLLLPLMFMLKPPRQVMWLFGLGMGFVLCITSVAWIARYLLPAYPSLTIVVAYILVNVGNKLRLKISFWSEVGDLPRCRTSRDRHRG